ncbi:MAG: branched-chain amino acid ABC transporter permease [Pseudomonadota bacterium]
MTRQTLLLLAALAVLIAVPFFATESYTRHLFILAFLYAIIASNWDLSLGHAGLFNFGHMTFFAMGVYTAAILAKAVELTPWLAIPIGGVTAAAAAFVVAAPVARLKGIYVVLITFAFSQVVLQLILSQSDLTGGAGGMVRIPPLEWGEYRFHRDQRFGYFYIALGLLVVSTVFLLWLRASPFGKSLIALRDSEEYALARGIPVTRNRVLALVLSSIFPGIAGGFFAIYLRVASPEVLSFSTLSLALSMVLVGGAGTIVGPIIAAFAIIFATEALAGFRGMEEARFIVVAISMILVLRFFPGGLAQLIRR